MNSFTIFRGWLRGVFLVFAASFCGYLLALPIAHNHWLVLLSAFAIGIYAACLHAFIYHDYNS